MKLISIVVPCYNEEPCLEDFYSEIVKVSSEISQVKFEYIFVDDGSKDKTLEILKQLREKDKRVEFVSFSRNFGKESGLIAGIEASKGDYVAVMDADLQDPPKLLIEMYDFLEKNEDYDCVATRRVSRKGEPIIRSFFARSFYKIINKMSTTEIMDGARDFRLMSRKMVDAIISLPEYNRFSKGLFQWVGFNTKWIEYENIERVKGETKWSFWKLFLYSIDGILAFSTVPLAIASVIGFIISAFSFILAIKFIIEKLVIGIAVDGFATLIVMVSFLGGLQLLCIGILGQYMAKSYTEVKKRPKYIVRQSTISINNKGD